MSRSFPVSGLKELDRYLAALPKNMQKQAYKSALTAAAAVIRDEARILAPKQTGLLAKSIKSGSPRQNPDGTFSISVRPRGNHAFIGLFHEFGVAPHLISGKIKQDASGKQRRGVLKIGDRFVAGVISHPGHAAHPFMRPALDLKGEAAVQAFATRIRAFIEKKTAFVAPMDEAA